MPPPSRLADSVSSASSYTMPHAAHAATAASSTARQRPEGSVGRATALPVFGGRHEMAAAMTPPTATGMVAVAKAAGCRNRAH